MTSRLVRAIAAVAAFVVVLLCTIGPRAGVGWALAARGPTLELTIIHATRSDGGTSIDPQLRDLPQLTRDQPFVRYNVYKLLDRKALSLEPGRALSIDLPNGRALEVTLVDQAGEGQAARYHVRAEIGESGKKAFLKLLEVTASGGEPFFVGGQSFEGGTLFLEFVVRP